MTRLAVRPWHQQLTLERRRRPQLQKARLGHSQGHLSARHKQYLCNQSGDAEWLTVIFFVVSCHGFASSIYSSHSDYCSMRHHMCTRLGRRDVEQRYQIQNETSRKEGGRCGAREGEPMGYQQGGLWQPDAKAMEAHAEGATEGHMELTAVMRCEA